MAKRPARPSSAKPSSATEIPNRLLAALPREEYERLVQHLSLVPIKVKQVLHKNGEAIKDVYFPTSGVCSITTVMADGSMVEVTTIGNEGMVGIHAFLGEDIPSSSTMVQVGDGTAIKLSLAAFKREVRRGGRFQEVINRYTQAVVSTMMQSIACNTLHSLRHRCARWLLSTQDRIHGDEFGLSHEFLAIMLGAQRPTVTVVAGGLQKAGLIQYRHGRVRVLDRKGLEAASCECYRTIRAHFERVHH